MSKKEIIHGLRRPQNQPQHSVVKSAKFFLNRFMQYMLSASPVNPTFDDDEWKLPFADDPYLVRRGKSILILVAIQIFLLELVRVRAGFYWA